MMKVKAEFNQRLLYLQENLVRSGLVWKPWHFKNSCVMDYCRNEKWIVKN
jgi:hypothetical protein